MGVLNLHSLWRNLDDDIGLDVGLLLAPEGLVQDVHLRDVVEGSDELDRLLLDSLAHFQSEVVRVQGVLDPKHGAGHPPEPGEIRSVVDVGERRHRQYQWVRQPTAVTFAERKNIFEIKFLFEKEER